MTECLYYIYNTLSLIYQLKYYYYWCYYELKVNFKLKFIIIFIIADDTMANTTNIVADIVTINFLSIDFIFFFFKILEFFTCDF